MMDRMAKNMLKMIVIRDREEVMIYNSQNKR